MASTPGHLCPSPSLPERFLTEFSPLFLCDLEPGYSLFLKHICFLASLVCLQKCLLGNLFSCFFSTYSTQAMLPSPSTDLESRTITITSLLFFVMTVFLYISPTRLFRSRTLFYFMSIFSTPGIEVSIQ